MDLFSLHNGNASGCSSVAAPASACSTSAWIGASRLVRHERFGFNRIRCNFDYLRITERAPRRTGRQLLGRHQLLQDSGQHQQP